MVTENRIGPLGVLDGSNTPSCTVQAYNLLHLVRLSERGPGPVRLEGFSLDSVGCGFLGQPQEAFGCVESSSSYYSREALRGPSPVVRRSVDVVSSLEVIRRETKDVGCGVPMTNFEFGGELGAMVRGLQLTDQGDVQTRVRWFCLSHLRRRWG